MNNYIITAESENNIKIIHAEATSKEDAIKKIDNVVDVVDLNEHLARVTVINLNNAIDRKSKKEVRKALSLSTKICWATLPDPLYHQWESLIYESNKLWQ